jgi:ubiquinol-cytochrome c reductase cytochrome c1 subunit
VKKNILIVLGLLALILPGLATAAGPGVKLDKADIDVTNTASLQRGAKYFVNYCMGCHSLKHARYSRLASDLGLNEAQVRDNLIFTRTEDGDKTAIGALMANAMRVKDGKEWFGTTPPDLTLVARARGEDWIYTFLRGFYLDPSRPFGVNNTAFDNVGMPHVLWELQGWQRLAEHGDSHTAPVFEQAESGRMTPAEYDQVVRDLVSFLSYVGEPRQTERKVIGFWVMLFLVVLFVVTYLLKKEYWRDVH